MIKVKYFLMILPIMSLILILYLLLSKGLWFDSIWFLFVMSTVLTLFFSNNIYINWKFQIKELE